MHVIINGLLRVVCDDAGKVRVVLVNINHSKSYQMVTARLRQRACCINCNHNKSPLISSSLSYSRPGIHQFSQSTNSSHFDLPKLLLWYQIQTFKTFIEAEVHPSLAWPRVQCEPSMARPIVYIIQCDKNYLFEDQFQR